MKPTWKPHDEHGKLDTAERNHLPETVYAFPRERKEPLTDASHVRNAIARFDQVKGVSDAERDQAFANLQAAAKHYSSSVRPCASTPSAAARASTPSRSSTT